MPTALSAADNSSFEIHVALHPQIPGTTTWQTTLKEVEAAYNNIYPDGVFDYEFLDASIAKLYSAEQRIKSLLAWATGLTIFISCLGLAGLVIYTSNLRVKEIGVRKVLGASVTHIVTLLSKDFVKLMCIAFLIATPVAWFTLHKWLENYVYRVSMSWWLFPLCGAWMMLITLLTMSIRIIQAALANPVKSLRSE